MDEKATNSEKDMKGTNKHGKIDINKDSDYLMQLRQDLIKKQFLAQSSKKYHQNKKSPGGLLKQTTMRSKMNTTKSDLNSAASDDEDFDFDDDNQVDLDEIGEVVSDDGEDPDTLEPSNIQHTGTVTDGS